jgi:hypothetical protein
MGQLVKLFHLIGDEWMNCAQAPPLLVEQAQLVEPALHKFSATCR